MKKHLLHGVIAIDLLVFYFLLIVVVYYLLLGLEPVLWMGGVLAVLVLLRLASLHLTWRERASARRAGERLSKRATAIVGSSLACIIMLTLGAACYLFIRFGWLPALLYGVLALIVGGIFEASYAAFEVSEAAIAW